MPNVNWIRVGFCWLIWISSCGWCAAAATTDIGQIGLEKLYHRQPINGVVQYRDPQWGPVVASVLKAEALGEHQVVVTAVSDGSNCHACAVGIGAIVWHAASGKVLAANRWIMQAGHSGQAPGEIFVTRLGTQPLVVFREGFANGGETVERYGGLSVVGNHWRPVFRTAPISVYLDLAKCRGVCYDRVSRLDLQPQTTTMPILKVRLLDRANQGLLGVATYTWHTGKSRFEPYSTE